MLDRTTIQLSGRAARTWPPPAWKTYQLREALLAEYKAHPSRLTQAKAYYAMNSGEFVNTWCDTYDPRNALSLGRTTRMPFVLFDRQWDLFRFLRELQMNQVHGLIEKSRDMGATWGAGGFSVSNFLFVEGTAIGWGSRKADLVDNGEGDLDSIFEKIRYTIRSVPSVFYPPGFDPDRDMTHMKVVSPRTESAITGESGDNIGRGGRKGMYFKDESAHYERPEVIEAALADNTNVQVDISSVHGLGNVFHRKREGGVEWIPGNRLVDDATNVLVLDWRDHPLKDQRWYDVRRRKAVNDGILHVFKQEVDRDYAASIEGAIIPGEWIKAAIDAHKKIPGMDEGSWMAGLDVADGGMDRNALVRRRGVVLEFAEEWSNRDTGVTTRKTIELTEDCRPIQVMYDCIGVGSGVKSEVNRLMDLDLMPSQVQLIPWNAGAAVLDPEGRVVKRADGSDDPDSPTNKDFFYNLKAQGWWMLRRRFEKVYRFFEEGIDFPPWEMISISSKIPKLRSLEKELAQPTQSKSAANLKLVVNKTPDGTKSPNLGDAAMQCYWPVLPSYDSTYGWVA